MTSTAKPVSRWPARRWPARRWPARRWPGLVLVALAVLAMGVSVGMPGGGWLIGSAALLLGSLLVRTVGWRALAANLIIYALHMFSLGPLSPSAGPGVPPLVLLLTAAPAVAAGVAILRSLRYQREQQA